MISGNDQVAPHNDSPRLGDGAPIVGQTARPTVSEVPYPKITVSSSPQITIWTDHSDIETYSSMLTDHAVAKPDESWISVGVLYIPYSHTVTNIARRQRAIRRRSQARVPAYNASKSASLLGGGNRLKRYNSTFD